MPCFLQASLLALCNETLPIKDGISFASYCLITLTSITLGMLRIPPSSLAAQAVENLCLDVDGHHATLLLGGNLLAVPRELLDDLVMGGSTAS